MRAERREHGRHLLEVLGVVRPGHQRQGAGHGARDAPGDGRVDQPDPGLLERCAERDGAGGIRRAHVHDDGAGAQRRGDPAVPLEHDGRDGAVVRQHRHDDVDTREVGGCERCSTAHLLGDRRAHGLVRVVQREREPRLGEVPHHRGAHVSETDEPDPQILGRRTHARPSSSNMGERRIAAALREVFVVLTRVAPRPRGMSSRSSTSASVTGTGTPSGPSTTEDSLYQRSGARPPQNERQLTSRPTSAAACDRDRRCSSHRRRARCDVPMGRGGRRRTHWRRRAGQGRVRCCGMPGRGDLVARAQHAGGVGDGEAEVVQAGPPPAVSATS